MEIKCPCMCHDWYKEGLHCSVCRAAHQAAPLLNLLDLPTAKPSLASFQSQEEGRKTKKLSPKASANTNNLISEARNYILTNTEGVTRIEFPKDGLYYVVAKLKDRD